MGRRFDPDRAHLALVPNLSIALSRLTLWRALIDFLYL